MILGKLTNETGTLQFVSIAFSVRDKDSLVKRKISLFSSPKDEDQRARAGAWAGPSTALGMVRGMVSSSNQKGGEPVEPRGPDKIEWPSRMGHGVEGPVWFLDTFIPRSSFGTSK